MSVPVNSQAPMDLNLNLVPTSIGNPTNEKFLLYFIPRDVLRQACCGCSLRTGVQVVAVLFIASTLSSFFAAIRMSSIPDLIVTGILLSLYVMAGICALYAAATFNYSFASIAHLVYSLVFFFNVANYVVLTLLIFIGFYSPFGVADTFKAGLVFLVASAIILGVQGYMIYIIFSFMVHVRNNRIGLLMGDLYKMYSEYPVGDPLGPSVHLTNQATVATDTNPNTQPII